MRVFNLFKNVHFCHITYRSSVGFTHSRKMSGIKSVVVSGPSGAGKGTLLDKLMKEFPKCFAFSVSHTTRSPRAGEENGKHYHFVTHDAFKDLIAKNGFLEHAEFSGNCYGTSKQAVKDIEETGRICILEVEINGVKSIKKSGLNARYIFVSPPSIEELEKRLRDRGSETEETLKKRLATANEAMTYSKQPNVYDHIVVNDNLEEAYKKLKEILMEDIKKLR